MANLSAATNTLHVSVGLLTATYIKNKNDNINQIGADPSLTIDQKENAIERLKATQKKAALTAYTINKGIDLAINVADYYVSDIGRRSGDSNYQLEIDRQLSIASWISNTGFSTIGSIGAGFALGGIVGASIMGVISLTSSIASRGMQITRENREYQWKLFEDNQRIEILKQRASLTDYNGRNR